MVLAVLAVVQDQEVALLALDKMVLVAAALLGVGVKVLPTEVLEELGEAVMVALEGLVEVALGSGIAVVLHLAEGGIQAVAVHKVGPEAVAAHTMVVQAKLIQVV